MIVEKVEEQLIKDVIKCAQTHVLIPSVLGVFGKDTKEELIANLDALNFNQVINIKTCEEYDEWFNKTASNFHNNIFHLYRKNLIIDEDNPFTYSSRLLNQYIRHLTFFSRIFLGEIQSYLFLHHPIISNNLIDVLEDIDINQLSDIKNKEQYYSIVESYRAILKKKFELMKYDNFLDLKMGMDV